MKNILLGFLIGFSAVSYGLEKHKDGSVTLTREEMDTLTLNWYQHDQAFKLAVRRIEFLQKQLENCK